jgi:hypothetical protein
LLGAERESLLSVDYIDLTERSRLAIEPDPVPLDPRRDECITGCYTPPSWWGNPTYGPEPRHDFPGPIVEADNRLYDRTSFDAERGVQRWAWTFYGILVERHGGTYWYCDRQAFENMIGGEFTRALQHDIIEADRQAYERYLNGEARIITLQRKATFKRITRRFHEKQKELPEVWEDVASVGDIYLAERESVAQVAWDYFPLQKKERTIVSAMIDAERKDPSVD